MQVLNTKKILIVLLLLLVGAIHGGAETAVKKLKVVVYSLDAQGVDKSVTETLTSLITDELSQSEKVEVRDEKTTIAILKEQGLAQSGHCSAETCRIDNARLIKADLIILGSVGKMSSGLILISIRVADVNGTTIYPQKQTCKNCSDDELISIVEQMARNIRTFLETGKKPVPPKTVSTSPQAVVEEPTVEQKTGEIEVTVNIAGATISLDGKQMGKSSQGKALKINNVAAGDHKIKVTHPSYEDALETVSVEAGQKSAININLSGKSGGVRITTTPVGATVKIGGVSQGQTPLTLNLAPGSYSAEVSLDGYETAQQNFQVEAGKNSTIKVILKKIQQAMTPSPEQYTPSPVGRIDFSGTYTMTSNGATLTLVLKQDAKGGITGSLSSNKSGARFQLDAKIDSESVIGRFNNGVFCQAHFKGDQLVLTLMDANQDGQPDKNTAKQLFFTRQSG